MLGDIADGGGEYTVVSDVEFVVTVLSVVDSVTMGSATATVDIIITITKTNLDSNIFLHFHFLVSCIVFMKKVLYKSMKFWYNEFIVTIY